MQSQPIQIWWVILERDCLSPLLFCIALNALTHELNKADFRYQLHGTERKISHPVVYGWLETDSYRWGRIGRWNKKLWNLMAKFTMTFVLKIVHIFDNNIAYSSIVYQLLILSISKINLYGCPRRKGQYSGRSQYRYFLSKIFIWTCVLFRTVSEVELFECSTAKLLIRMIYYVYVLFLIPVFIVQVTQLVQFIINIRKFHRQHQCTLQLVWRHGVLFVWVRLNVPLCRR